MDVLICEDDPVTRSVISDLVEDNGGRVLAAVDSPLQAMAFLDRFAADLVIVDLMLRHGNGLPLVDHVLRNHPSAQVIVFTANDSFAKGIDDSILVVVKPDFERLGRILTSSGERTGERRRPVRSVPPVPAGGSGHAFYQLISEAQPEDVLVSVQVDGDGDEVVRSLRAALRSRDAVLQRTDRVVALLVGGGTESVEALRRRLEDSSPDLAGRVTSMLAGGDPVDAFARLTST